MEHLWKVVFLIVLFVFVPRWLWSQETKTKLALLKYKGGGDWYANPTSLPNLIRFCNDKLGTDLLKSRPLSNREAGIFSIIPMCI